MSSSSPSLSSEWPQEDELLSDPPGVAQPTLPTDTELLELLQSVRAALPPLTEPTVSTQTQDSFSEPQQVVQDPTAYRSTTTQHQKPPAFVSLPDTKPINTMKNSTPVLSEMAAHQQKQTYSTLPAVERTTATTPLSVTPVEFVRAQLEQKQYQLEQQLQDVLRSRATLEFSQVDTRSTCSHNSSDRNEPYLEETRVTEMLMSRQRSTHQPRRTAKRQCLVEYKYPSQSQSQDMSCHQSRLPGSEPICPQSCYLQEQITSLSRTAAGIKRRAEDQDILKILRQASIQRGLQVFQLHGTPPAQSRERSQSHPKSGQDTYHSLIQKFGSLLLSALPKSAAPSASQMTSSSSDQSQVRTPSQTGPFSSTPMEVQSLNSIVQAQPQVSSANGALLGAST